MFCKLTGTASSEIKEAIDCVTKGDEISLSMDYDKGKYTVETYSGIIGWLTKSDSKKVEDIAETNNKVPECLVGYVSDKYVPESGSAHAEVLILFDDDTSIKPVDFKEDGTGFTLVMFNHLQSSTDYSFGIAANKAISRSFFPSRHRSI